jgi:hypothetical protein
MKSNIKRIDNIHFSRPHSRRLIFTFCKRNIVKILRSKTGDAIGIELNSISFKSLLRALRQLSDLRMEKSTQNPLNDEALATFFFKGIKFQIHTPISDYWIDKPKNCPDAVFNEIALCLEQFHTRWWHRIF